MLTSVLFYIWCALQLNFVASIIGTTALLILLFLSHRRRYLSCAVFTAVALLMFADIVFHSFYDGYLTVELLGSARFLGDVTDVIVLLLKPRFFTVFLGPAMAWAGAVMLRRAQATSAESAWTEKDPEVGKEPQEAKAGKDTEAMGKGGLTKKQRRCCGAAAVIALAVLVLNPLKIPFIQSISSTEIISYHIKDIVQNTTGYGKIQYDAEVSMEYASDEEDPLFGVAEGKNLIVIQVEALQNFVIDRSYNGQELTPVLNNLIGKDTIYFDNYYMQIAAGNTSDAEFATNNSIYGSGQSYTYELYKDNAFRGLPWLLMERGYSTVAMHGYDGQFWSRADAYETQGFETFIDGDGFRIKGTRTVWGVNDEDFFTQAVDYLMGQSQPFYGFLITLSSHTPFELPEKLSTLELKEEDQGTMFGNYLRSIHYTDAAIGTLIQELKRTGLYEKSVIAIYGDHFGLSISDPDNVKFMSDFLGRQYRFSDAANIPLLIHIPGAGEEAERTVSVAGGQTDFLPTIAYLLGFEKLDTLYMGRNLLAENQQGFVVQNRYAKKGTFITNEYCYTASADELFENGKAYRLKSDEELELTEEMRRLFEMACGTVDLAQEYLDTDALRELYYADGRPDRVETQRVSVKKPAAQPKPATTPAAVEEPIPPVEQPQGAEQLPEEQAPSELPEEQVLPELPEEQSHTQTVEPGANAEMNGSGDSTDASDEPKDVEDAFCQDDEFDGSISEE
ncbi:MAG: sulfatase-like hydrolase/transferase, partial [Firmicutes bacterium]|nr:sulfatase-like hydrolase/transferase [Bacillota bacterium]